MPDKTDRTVINNITIERESSQQANQNQQQSRAYPQHQQAMEGLRLTEEVTAPAMAQDMGDTEVTVSLKTCSQSGLSLDDVLDACTWRGACFYYYHKCHNWNLVIKTQSFLSLR